MKLSKITTLAALIALCFAGSAVAHDEPATVNDASVGNSSVTIGNDACAGGCGGYSVGNNNGVYEGATGIGSDAISITHWGSGEGAISIGSKSPYVHDGSPLGNTDAVAVAAYQKQLARHAASANTLIEDNAEILSPSCLVQVETLQRSLRNAYSSTGGQLPLNEPPFARNSPEFRGYVAALVDRSEQTSTQIESMVARNCQDPDATSFYRGEVAGPWQTEIGKSAN